MAGHAGFQVSRGLRCGPAHVGPRRRRLLPAIFAKLAWLCASVYAPRTPSHPDRTSRRPPVGRRRDGPRPWRPPRSGQTMHARVRPHLARPADSRRAAGTPSFLVVRLPATLQAQALTAGRAAVWCGRYSGPTSGWFSLNCDLHGGPVWPVFFFHRLNPSTVVVFLSSEAYAYVMPC
jgi:hypothetical protein